MNTQTRTKKRMAAGVLAAFLAATTAFAAMAAEQKEKYTFTYKEQKIETGMSADGALKALGKEKDTKVLANCADDGGKDKAYLYDGFEVVTTKVNKKEVVKEINLTGSEVCTEEGLKVGDLPATVKKIYPDAKNENGLYSVILGDTQLVIDCGFKDDKVVMITYEAVEKK
ncbi:MAG: hypothetical protein HFG54_07515 [Lachnospiraceae bacterium]|jgi:hypothetical protein|nr:hypothetical protein [Lachnospiraceae bacterium]